MTLDELYRLLRSDHVQVQGIVDTLQEPLLVLDRGLKVLNANPAFYRTFQTHRDDTLGYGLLELGNGQWNIPELHRLLLEVVPKSAAIIGYEVTHDFPDLGVRTIQVSARQLIHPDHNSTQLLVVFDDVTEQVRSDAARDILAAETRHRMKNLTAMLKTIVQRTEAKGRSAEEYRDVLIGRFEAVLDAQEFVASHRGGTDLASLVVDLMERSAGPRAVVAPGPSVSVSPFQVLPATMILHELATNAFKYGALSNETGTVRISWLTEARGDQTQLVLDWQEDGGPPVASPTRRGFGTHLVHFSAQSEGGSAMFSFLATGLHVQVRIPVTS